jgi:hypothetical protein
MIKNKLGTVGGLTLTAETSAYVSFVATFIVLIIAGTLVLDLPLVAIIIGAAIGTVWHWVAEFLHQYGHALAASRIGHPMIGLHFWGNLGRSIYPPNEGKLKPREHIFRALGGPAFSTLITIVLAILLIIADAIGGAVYYTVLFMFLDNLLVFTLGPWLPLGFTDGSTLVYWLRHA